MGLTNLPELNSLRLPTRGTSMLSSRTTAGRLAGRFLRGPISWVWLSRAAKLPGRALHVALAIRLWTGIKKTNDIVVPTTTLGEMGVTRHSARRALHALERAGLITVTRHVGRKTRVHLLDVGEPAALGNNWGDS
jgi:hypothetical protein